MLIDNVKIVGLNCTKVSLFKFDYNQKDMLYYEAFKLDINKLKIKNSNIVGKTK